MLITCRILSQTSGITYLRTRAGWLYLCAVRDGCSRRVSGWAMDSVQNTDLVERALQMARTLRGELPRYIVFHADRGAQCTSAQLWEAAKELGVLQSVGRTGVRWDNAMQESFRSTLKSECFDRRSWLTRPKRRLLSYTGSGFSITAGVFIRSWGGCLRWSLRTCSGRGLSGLVCRMQECSRRLHDADRVSTSCGQPQPFTVR